MIGFPKTKADFKKGELAFPHRKERPDPFKIQSELYFQELDFFSPQKKSWRPFPLQKALKGNFVFKPIKAPSEGENPSPLLPSSLLILVQNGRPFPPSFQKEKDISLCSWRDFCLSKVKLKTSIREKIFSTLKKQRNPFCYLSNAFYPNGWILIIKKKLSRPLEIHYTQESSENQQGLNLRNFIFLEEGAEAQILECFHSRPEKKPLFLNIQTDSYLGKKAMLEHIRSEEMGEQDMMVNQLFAHLSEEARASLFSLSLNVGAVQWLNAIDQAEKSLSSDKGLSLLGKRQIACHKLSARLRGPEGQNRQIYKSFLLDSAQQVFQGSISIEKQAQKSDTEQLSQNFLFGKRAMALAFPKLDISADNVKAHHGATVSPSAESEELAFYMGSRGIEPSQVFDLILSGLMKEPLSDLKEKSGKAMEKLIQKKLSSIEIPMKIFGSSEKV